MLEADPRWYEKLADGQWHDEAFRDPWVLPDPDGNGWHMLITARANHGPADDRGVVGHAWSPDLRNWELQPPLTEPGQDSASSRSSRSREVDGQDAADLLLPSPRTCRRQRATRNHRRSLGRRRRRRRSGPYDIADAQQLTDSDLYVGRLIQRSTNRSNWMFLAFRHDAHDGTFVGEIGDPQTAHWDGSRLRLSPIVTELSA